MTRHTRSSILCVAFATVSLGGCQSKATQDARVVDASDTTAIAATTSTTSTAATSTAAGATPATAPTAGACNARMITAEGIGPIRIGARVDSVKKLCDVARDTTQRGAEGMMERRATISIPPGELDAEIVDGRVWRLDIKSSAFRTADSLGVGSSLAELLRHKQLKPAAGEGIVVVMLADHCGMSFVLSGGYSSGVFHKWSAEELAKLPASTKVARVLVFGCEHKGA